MEQTLERIRSESQDLEEEEEEEITEVGGNGASQRPSNLSLESTPRKSLFVREGDGHKIWKPKRKHPQLYYVVQEVMRNRTLSENSEAEPELSSPVAAKKESLWQRQQMLVHRVRATQAVLKEQEEELISEDIHPSQHKKHVSLQDASKRIMETLKQQKSKQLDISDMAQFYGQRRGVMPTQKWRQTCHQHKSEVRAKTAHNLGKSVPSSDSSNKLHLSPKGNRLNLVTRYKQPPIPSKEVFATSGQQQKSDLSPKSSAGSKEHCRQGISPEVEGSTNL